MPIVLLALSKGDEHFEKGHKFVQEAVGELNKDHKFTEEQITTLKSSGLPCAPGRPLLMPFWMPTIWRWRVSPLTLMRCLLR